MHLSTMKNKDKKNTDNHCNVQYKDAHWIKTVKFEQSVQHISISDECAAASSSLFLLLHPFLPDVAHTLVNKLFSIVPLLPRRNI